MSDNSDRIHNCHRHAARCQRWADLSVKGKASFQDLEQRWLALARSYEEADRLARLLPAGAADRVPLQIEERAKAEAEAQDLQRCKTIEQVVPSMAHDFNNILTVVIMNACALATTSRDPADRHAAGLICDAARRGAKISQQIIALSRNETLRPKVIDLNDNIAGMNALLRATLGDAIQLQTALAPGLWHTMAHPTDFESAALNLVMNARDAMPSGGIATVSTFNALIERPLSGPAEPGAGQYAGLVVRDTGTGIARDVLPSVFEPFFTTKPFGKGSGLGLAQVLSFAKGSGGGVRIESQPGLGTTVKIFLPRSHVPAALAAVSA